MRGKGQTLCGRITVYGITPAYAGKRRGQCQVFGSTQDHPRLCGEKDNLHADVIASAGSPPPMRGKVHFRPYAFCL